uniref:Laminin G domain-containing protein n=1 Tax=Panagrolaimus superbus TaxID=310955 RepID=A0A914XSU9_9BILA
MERPVHSIRVEQVRVDDGKWHKFVLFQAWENVKIQLDNTVLFKILTQRSFVFGNLRTNSDVFVGGLPTVRTFKNLAKCHPPFDGIQKDLRVP